MSRGGWKSVVMVVRYEHASEERDPPLSSENEGKCSGGETRTLNLAVNSRLLCH